jgi:integrase
MRKRKISSYILDWKTDLTQKGYKPQTIQMYLTGLKTFYADNDIELPRIRLKTIIKKEDINDIPNKEQIRETLKYSNPKYTAIILLISSSGMGSNEIRGLKIKDLLNSLKEYIKHPLNNRFDIEVLTEIQQ